MSTDSEPILRQVTFTDTLIVEDTLSFHKDLVENVEVLFSQLEENNGKLCQDYRNYHFNESTQTKSQWNKSNLHKIGKKLNAKIW